LSLNPETTFFLKVCACYHKIYQKANLIPLPVQISQQPWLPLSKNGFGNPFARGKSPKLLSLKPNPLNAMEPESPRPTLPGNGKAEEVAQGISEITTRS
jgi:hypothetical protein